jgi:hypothetical protein
MANRLFIAHRIAILCGLFIATMVTRNLMASELKLDSRVFKAEGLGISLSVPIISDADVRTFQFPRSLAPNDGFWPIYQDIFICKGWFCRKRYGGTITVQVRRHRNADENFASSDKEQTRQRALKLLEIVAESIKKTSQATREQPKSVPLAGSLNLLYVDGKYWAKITEIDQSGRPNGLTYWQILDNERTLGIFLDLDLALIPKGSEFIDIDKFMDNFAMHTVAYPEKK